MLTFLKSGKLLRRFLRWPVFLIDSVLPAGSKRKGIYDRIAISIRMRGLLGTILRSLEEIPPIKNARLHKYDLWIKNNEPAEEALRLQREEAKSFSCKPLISIIVPVFNTDRDILVKMIQSVEAQTYANWQLCIAEGNSDRPYIREILEDRARRDRMIKVVFLSENKGIAGNSNEALSLASGDYIAFLDHDDELSPNALYEVASLLTKKPDADFIYSDEDKLNEKGGRYEPHFKPDWSPDTFRSHNYVCHFTVIGRALVDEVGGFRQGYDGSQDYDLFLRATEKAKCIEHIPKILYHWRSVRGSAADNVTAKTYAFESAKKALRDHLARVGLQGDVQDGYFLRSYRTTYRIEGSPLVIHYHSDP